MNSEWRESVVFIAIGSNIEPERNIPAALTMLIAKTRVLASSTFYQTTPIGRSDQPMYVNGVWVIGTNVEPRRVREDLLSPIEQALGRQRSKDKFAARTIDLDMVLYDDLVVEAEGLRLPHPDITRPFVCGPIAELLAGDSAGVQAELKRRIRELLPGDAADTCPGEALCEMTCQLRQLLA